MKKLDLLKPGGSRALQLTRLAREINDCEDGITGQRDKITGLVKSCGCDAALQGQRLLQAKEFVGHGHFLGWLAAHCPTTSPRMASNYMRYAANEKRVSYLSGGADSLRAVIAFASAEENPSTNGNGLPPKSWPAYIEALGKWARFAGYVARHPIAAWPAEGRDKLKGDLLPVAIALWPEKFA